MMANILARASTADIAGAANPMNPPGAWEFFLSHHQALGGDMMQRLSLLFDNAGKTSWYDNRMLDKSEKAMEEGVKNCKNCVLLLTAETTTAHTAPAVQSLTHARLIGSGDEDDDMAAEPVAVIELDGDSAFSAGSEGSDAGSVPSSVPSEADWSVTEGATPFASTHEWLADIKLEMCHAALKELGYDEDMQMVIDGDDEEVQDMIGAVEGVEGVKKSHLKKFKRELAKVRGKNEQFP